MNVAARGIIKPRVSFNFSEGSFHIRVDCACNNEAWIEMNFNEKELELVKQSLHRVGDAGMGHSLIVLRSEDDEVFDREILKVPTHWQPDFKRMVNGDQPSEEFSTHFAVHKGMQAAFEEIMKERKS